MHDTPSDSSFNRFEKNYFDEKLQKIAKVAAAKWPSLAKTLTWEDIHCEGCIRLEKAEHNVIKRGKPISNRNGFYYRICSNYCHEVYRNIGGVIDPVELLLLGSNVGEIDKWELLITMLYQFGLPCSLLLFLFYLAEPPVKDKEVLYRIAIFFGANLQASKGIDNKMMECRQKFREFAAKHPNFNDLFS